MERPFKLEPHPGSSGPGAADDVIFKDTPSFGTASAMGGLTAVNNMTFENAKIIDGERSVQHPAKCKYQRKHFSREPLYTQFVVYNEF